MKKSVYTQRIKVKDFDSLEREIARLKLRTRELEYELGDRVDFFKGNYKKMALNSVIPGGARNSGFLNIAGNVAKFAFKNASFKNLATGALMTAIEFLGVKLGINLVNKLAGRRKRKQQQSDKKSS